MTGRGLDQILPHPGSPVIHETYACSALDYVRLAEDAGKLLDRPVAFEYVWGDALAIFEATNPAARIVNLETAVTGRGEPCPGKGIHYRMHPQNAPCLTAARIDCCVLANNHILDWGEEGLRETLAVLHEAGIRTAGAGLNASDAQRPAMIEGTGGSGVLVHAMAMPSSGVPDDWAAGPGRPGVRLVGDLSEKSVRAIAADIRTTRRPGFAVVASIHWGPNWGYEISREQRRFAHQLIESAGVDIVHGHSSHHPLAIEVYGERLILYGCGDFLNDYEGIGGYESYRPDLTLMYLPALERGTGRLVRLELVPMRIRQFRVSRASDPDAAWLAERLDEQSRGLGTRIRHEAGGQLTVSWR
jgi:poly-gamma-glutamate synthesis protein (capsule biosynthesis protein)